MIFMVLNSSKLWPLQVLTSEFNLVRHNSIPNRLFVFLLNLNYENWRDHEAQRKEQMSHGLEDAEWNDLLDGHDLWI